MESTFFLIKERFPIHPAGKIIRAEDYQAYLRSQEIITQAEVRSREIIDEADELIAKASIKAEKIIASAKTAYQVNKNKGYAIGLKNAKSDAAKQMTQTIMEARLYLASIEKEIADTVISALRLILGEIGHERVLRRLVLKALNHARDQRHIKLRVSPDQLPMVEKFVAEIAKNFKDIDFIEIAADSTLDPDGCILETKMGSVDTSLRGQLQNIHAVLLKRFQQNR